MLPDHHTLLFDQASNGGLGTLTPTTGKLYTVAIGAGGPGPLSQIWESGPGDAPDGCALASSGDIYIALVGTSNQIVEVNRSGQEIARFGQQFTGTNNSSVPFDSPSGVAFLGTRLIIANQSYAAGTKANQALLELLAGALAVPRGRLTLVSGEQSRNKRVRVEGVDAATALGAIMAALAPLSADRLGGPKNLAR